MRCCAVLLELCHTQIRNEKAGIIAASNAMDNKRGMLQNAVERVSIIASITPIVAYRTKCMRITST